MKLNKIFALMLAATMATACSDDDNNWNSSDVTVNMLQEVVSVKENKGIFNVPVVVEGEMNGAVEVTVEVAESGSNPAMDDVHYYVTSKTIVVSAESGQANIEISTVDNDEINEPREFTITIVKAKGATIGDPATTTVVVKDNDAAFYEKLMGKWTLTTADGSSWPVEIVGYEEGEEGYDQVLYVVGMLGYNWTTLELAYHYDITAQKGYLEIPYGTLFAEGVNFSGLGVMNVYACGAEISPEGNILEYLFDGSILGEWDADFKNITFEQDYIFAVVVDPASNAAMGYWNFFYGISLSR